MEPSTETVEIVSKPGDLLEKSTLIYSVMAAIGVALCFWGHGNLKTAFSFESKADVFLTLAAAGLGTGILIIFSYLFQSWFPSFRSIKDMMAQLVGPLSWVSAIYLAFISAVGEELLFRGAIQPYTGVFFASVIFGVLHLGPSGKISAWSIWAFLAGILLGFIFQSTGNLMGPILIHFAVNLVSLLFLRRLWQQKQQDAT